MFIGHCISRYPSTKIIGFDNGEKFPTLMKNGYSGTRLSYHSNLTTQLDYSYWYAQMPDDKKVEYLNNMFIS
jgi:hypothetical protein